MLEKVSQSVSHSVNRSLPQLSALKVYRKWEGGEEYDGDVAVAGSIALSSDLFDLLHRF